MSSLDRGVTGSYQLACEASKNKLQIDTWLNEGQSLVWISEQLAKLGDYISVNSISKYKKVRDKMIQKELEATPAFIAKQAEVTGQLNASIAKIQTVDLVGRLSELIEDSADLLQQAKDDDIRINSVKDMRMVQQTMLDAISIYGDTMLKAQEFDAIQNNPDLLKKSTTTINLNVRDTISDILKGVISNGEESGYNLIDRLRAGIGKSN